MLLQWLCIGRVVFEDELPADRVLSAIGFARLADKLGVTGVGSQMADLIKATMLDNSTHDHHLNHHDANIRYIGARHIHVASCLSKGHCVRRLLAKAAVEGFICSRNFSLLRELQEIPEFAADTLQELKIALSNVTVENSAVTFKDPLSGRKILLRP